MCAKTTTSLLALILGLAGAALARADAVIDWNNVILDAIRSHRTNPPVATRSLALLHTAVFDAVDGIVGGYDPYFVPGPGPVGASPEAAAAAAAHTILSAVYPDTTDVFDAALAQSLAAIPDGPAKTDGVAWGETCAAAILALRQNYGSSLPAPYSAPEGAGWWVPTPPAFAPTLLPNWPYVTPWTMHSGSQFRVGAPPTLTSDEYRLAFDEVRLLGDRDHSLRTADQSQIALFWNDGAGTDTPPGHWQAIAQAIAAAESNALIDNARLFALISITQADAAIVSWDNKYYYNHWRPYTGIVHADTDGNPATAPDPAWFNFITTPPFPTYTSGHSTFSGSSSRILAHFFGTDDVAFSATSDGLPGVTRSFTRLSQAAEEAGQSRIYGGIHWQYDNQAGLSSGRALADYVFFNFLRPVSPPGTCIEDDATLCLQGGRFRVVARWADFAQGSGPGHAVSAGDGSGGFWFFNPANPELTVKLLDACAPFDHFWVFAAGLTNVEVQLTVTDTETGRVKQYFNPLGRAFAPVQDTAAFATCP
jgi:PAP2 superfamily